MGIAAMPSIPDGSLDFVYIDGNHSEEYVRQDIRLWWPKVKIGGMLAGHDILGCNPKADSGIQSAVYDLMTENGLTVFMVPDTRKAENPWSWYVWRGGI